MSFNGSGTYTFPNTFVYDTVISETDVNANFTDGATGLSTCITKDGQTTITANLPMSTYRHTGVGNATARTDYAAAGQVQDGKLNWVDGGGTADAITASYTPAITALVDGQICYVRATAANATTTPTFAPNGLTAYTIVKNGGVALVAGDIVGDGHELILRYDLANTRWELLNPHALTSSDIGVTVQAYDADTTKNDVANTFTKTQTWTKGADVASASSLTLGDGNYFDVTGTTTVTAIATKGASTVIKLHFDGILTLTHNATSLVLPGGANITTAAGDEFEFTEYSTGNWRCTSYALASGASVAGGGGVFTESFTSADQTITAAGALTLAHGLSGIPKLIQMYLVCQTGQFSYTAGDVVLIDNHFMDSGTGVSRGQAVQRDATNIYLRFGLTTATYSLLDWTTGGYGDCTNANWQLRVKAWY